MGEAPSRQELQAAYCWEADDEVPRRPAMTEFRRRLRFHQAQWREANGHPIGSQPIAPRPHGKPARPVGSRLPLAYARETGANFLTANALVAARVCDQLVRQLRAAGNREAASRLPTRGGRQ
jgi:PD-(D/E)XK nuclease superfamily protein